MGISPTLSRFQNGNFFSHPHLPAPTRNRFNSSKPMRKMLRVGINSVSGQKSVFTKSLQFAFYSLQSYAWQSHVGKKRSSTFSQASRRRTDIPPLTKRSPAVSASVHWLPCISTSPTCRTKAFCSAPTTAAARSMSYLRAPAKGAPIVSRY